MAITGTIVLLLLSLSVDPSFSKTELRKCCPYGEVFSNITNEQPEDGSMTKYGCVPMPKFARELYKVSDRNVSVEEDGIPHYDKPEYINVTYLSNLKYNDTLEGRSCADIIIKSNRSVPVVAYYTLSEDEHEETTVETVPFPRFLNVNRCCPKNKVYDNSIRSCVSVPEIDRDGNNSDIYGFLSLLPKELDVNFLQVRRGIPPCKQVMFNYEINADDISFQDGSLEAILPSLGGEREKRHVINANNTCLELMPDFLSKRQLMARVCRSTDFCRTNKCIRKCCVEYSSWFNQSCTSQGLPESPRSFHEALLNMTNEEWNSTDYGLIIGSPRGRGVYTFSEDISWNIDSRGYVNIDTYGSHDYSNYCLEVTYNKEGKNQSFKPFLPFYNQEKAMAHVPIRFAIATTLQATSCVFLFLTLLVYACLPALQNLYGKTLMCHAFSLFVGFICLSTIPWVTPSVIDIKVIPHTSNFCSSLGYLMQCAFLSAFSWLNVMCFDIWRTFGRLRGDASRGQRHYKRFFLYCLYAWGLPLSITTFGIVSDKTQFLPEKWRPNIGESNCWFAHFADLYGQLIFFTLPITIQLIFNVAFFILTIVQCNKVKAEIRQVTDPLDPRSKRFHADKTKLVMNIKLFIVMGMTWSAEIVSFFINQYVTVPWKEQAFYVTDILNSLQGLLIFILFVMKPRVYKALRKRFGCYVPEAASEKIRNPFAVKKSASNNTLTSVYAVTMTPGP